VRVNRFEIVCAFELDPSIVLTCGPYLKSLQQKLGGKLLMINAPDDAPPSLPRVVLKLQDTILNVAFDRLHITTQPPSHVAQDMEKAVQFAYQRSNPIISDMQPAKLNYKWSGVVVEVEYPETPLTSRSAPEAATPLFDRLINIDRKYRELGSFQLQFGIRDNNYYVNYTLTAFEARQIKLPLPSQNKYISIDIKEYPLTECGLKVILDVNNKPEPESREPERDIKLMFNKQTELFANIAKTLNLEGILK
jgi:hypothetical protein